MVKDTYTFTASDKTPEDFVESFTRFYKPTFEAAEVGEKLGEFQNRLLALAKAQNRSTDGSTRIPANFLRVTISL